MEYSENNAKPFVKWAGGKGQLLYQIQPYLPQDLTNWKDMTYVEAFVGGGAMLFHMLKNFPNIKKAFVNDVNPNLVACYSSIKENPKGLIKALKKIESGYKKLSSEDDKKSFFLDQRDEFNQDRSSLSQEKIATLFIFLNRVCFNGLYRVNKKGLFNVPFGRNLNPTICDEQTIMADSLLLKKVSILNGDFEKTFQDSSANTLYYFDPPYRPLSATSNFKDYAKEEFNDAEQERLKQFCDRINESGQAFVLSNSDCAQTGDPYFDNLFKDYKIERVSASRMVNANAAGRGKITEILVHNK